MMNSELTVINYIDDDSNDNFMTNTIDNIKIKRKHL